MLRAEETHWGRDHLEANIDQQFCLLKKKETLCPFCHNSIESLRVRIPRSATTEQFFTEARGEADG